MKRYEDCYPDCSGEDCPCCEIYAGHQYETNYPDSSDDYDPDYDDDWDDDDWDDDDWNDEDGLSLASDEDDDDE